MSRHRDKDSMSSKNTKEGDAKNESKGKGGEGGPRTENGRANSEADKWDDGHGNGHQGHGGVSTTVSRRPLDLECTKEEKKNAGQDLRRVEG